MKTAYIYLAVAIVCEVIGTTALKASEQFTRPLPALLVVVGYGLSFYCLALVLRTVPVGITYALWAGLGIVLVTLLGIVWFGEKPDLPAVCGMALIIAGVVVINVFSGSAGH